MREHFTLRSSALSVALRTIDESGSWTVHRSAPCLVPRRPPGAPLTGQLNISGLLCVLRVLAVFAFNAFAVSIHFSLKSAPLPLQGEGPGVGSGGEGKEWLSV